MINSKLFTPWNVFVIALIALTVRFTFSKAMSAIGGNGAQAMAS